jgi:hypothetical protein
MTGHTTTLATGLAVIDERACLEFIRSGTVGHLALTSGGLPVVVPILYHLVKSSVVFASDGGLTLSAARRGAVACVGIDGMRDDTNWAVLITGRLREVTPQQSIGRDGETLRPWGLSTAQHYVALDIEIVDGAASPSEADSR